MFKKIVGVLFCAGLLGLAGSIGSAEKDGPFPMSKAFGTWQAQDGSGVKINIVGGTYNPERKTIDVTVVLMNQKGQSIAIGHTAHPLTNTELTMILVPAVPGPQMLLTVRAVYHKRFLRRTPRMDLVMSLKTLGDLPELSHYRMSSVQGDKD